MANVTINNLPTAITIDAVQDYLPIYTASSLATQKINRNTLLGITGSPVGTSDSQALTNKTIDNTNTVTLKDTLFTLQDDGDITKQAKFQLSGITTATTRTYTLPDVTDTLVTLTASQTLTNKTLTSPTINTATITNPTLSVDTVTGYTVSTLGTVYGLSISNGVLNSNNSVKTSNIQNAAVTADKLSTGGTSASVSTAETTTSAAYTDLATPGPAVTVTIGANGLALVSIGAQLSNNNASGFASMSFAASGANTQAAADAFGVYIGQQITMRANSVFLLTGLSAGSTTFTAKYAALVAGTTTASNRRIMVIPL